ncbi:MAG TPA: DUF1587 domain-containing protein, partial [Gemmataceae bacterium]|nr:DUF1587 domain-containing protein [Gemmataceae bacterium]
MQPKTAAYSPWTWRPFVACAVFAAAVFVATAAPPEKALFNDLAQQYTKQIRPLIARHCLQCHSTKKHKGDLDLERFTAFELVTKDVRPWQLVLEMVESAQMPPKGNAQPAPEDRQRMVRWLRGMLAQEARAHAGDPGRVVLRRLTNAEYNNTIRDLTGVDLQPARDFPVDGAAGEGFTNAGDALVISPALLSKYLTAAKGIAAHAVLVPDGFRFSAATTRRDWTDEVLTELRRFFAQYTMDGSLPLRPYLLALIRHRDALTTEQDTLAAVASREKLNGKYLQILWRTLNDKQSSFPLDLIRARWRQASERDADVLLADIAAWQAQLFRFVPIGSYRYGNVIRQLPNDPPVVEKQTLRLKLRPAPGQNDVVLHLAVRDLSSDRADGHVLWERPRFEGGKGAPLLLRDYAQYGAQFEIDYRAIFADSAQCLMAAVEAVDKNKRPPESIARQHGLDPALFKRWLDLLNLQSGKGSVETWESLRKLPATQLTLLDTRLPKNPSRPAVNGWTVAGADLPVLIANASNTTEHVPGRVLPHHVAVHPDPTRFVAAAWKSPCDGQMRVSARIAHAHPACGNGVTWWLELRRDNQSAVLADGNIDVGRSAEVPGTDLQIHKGDVLVLAVDPRDGNIACDLTEIGLTVTE